MRNIIGFKSGSSIVDRTFVLSPFSNVNLFLNIPSPSPTLQVHILVPITSIPTFCLLLVLVLSPTLREVGPVERLRQHAEERREGEVVVSGQEHVGLVRVRGAQGDEEVDDVAGVGSTVTVVAEEDDECGLEILWVDVGLEVGPKVLELGDVAVRVAYATDHSGSFGDLWFGDSGF